MWLEQWYAYMQPSFLTHLERHPLGALPESCILVGLEKIRALTLCQRLGMLAWL